ncbi:hypothetical protein [Bacillus massiliigorillae]|uniref:hypothetical protein n=1 Tax=Bacillus massiliigorillae TaxID=1243664 RepID=UPI00039CA53D|nr:hypothetical protein [Bacillus massiliigorillae]
MVETSSFKIEDMIVLTGISNTLSKMDEILDLVKPTFTNYFGTPYEYETEKLKQIPENNRYAVLTTDVLGDDNDAEVMFGFDFDSAEENQAPTLFASLYCQEDHPTGYALLEIVRSSTSPFDYYDDDGLVIAWFEIPLVTFLPLPNQKEEMVEWFNEKLKEIKEVIHTICRIRA